MVTLPTVIHGYLELHVPCNCQVFLDNFVIADRFPCDSDWAEKMGYFHIIPSNWTLMLHEELTYLSKFQKHSVRATLLTLVRLCFTNEVANQLGYTAAKTGTKPYFHNSVFFWGTLFYFQNVS
ncbi:hypothetical protein M8J76_004236 [Diaphorina citri]|nr:hypothetical protein M8J76_004236 [Diaphorina citri]